MKTLVEYKNDCLEILKFRQERLTAILEESLGLKNTFHYVEYLKATTPEFRKQQIEDREKELEDINFKIDNIDEIVYQDIARNMKRLIYGLREAYVDNKGKIKDIPDFVEKYGGIDKDGNDLKGEFYFHDQMVKLGMDANDLSKIISNLNEIPTKKMLDKMSSVFDAQFGVKVSDWWYNLSQRKLYQEVKEDPITSVHNVYFPIFPDTFPKGNSPLLKKDFDIKQGIRNLKNKFMSKKDESKPKIIKSIPGSSYTKTYTEPWTETHATHHGDVLFDEVMAPGHLAEGDNELEKVENEEEFLKQFGIDIEKYKKPEFLKYELDEEDKSILSEMGVSFDNFDFYNADLKDTALKLYLSDDDKKVITDGFKNVPVNPITKDEFLKKFNNEELSEIIKLEASLGEFKTLINNDKNEEAEVKMNEIKNMISDYTSNKEDNKTQGKTWILETIAPACDIFSKVYNYNYPLSASMDFYEKYNNASAKTEKDVDNIIERMANGEDVFREGENQIQDINNKQMGYTVIGLVGFITGALIVGIIILGILLK